MKIQIEDLIKLPNVPMNNEIWTYSNPKQVHKQARKYLGKNVPVYLSTNPKKKYMVKSPTDKWVHFGQMEYEDYSKHKNQIRQQNYLTRTANIRGNWKDNPYSPNNLSRNLLW